MNNKNLARIIAWSTLTLAAFTAVSCTSSLDERLERRNDAYQGLQDRREMRQDARDARDKAWRDRVLN